MDSLTSSLSAVGLLVLFVLARHTVRFTLVYRRNNLAAGLTLVLFGTGVYLWGWLGFAAFTMGTLFGAWQWVASIAQANEGVTKRRSPALLRRAVPDAVSQPSDPRTARAWLNPAARGIPPALRR